MNPKKLKRIPKHNLGARLLKKALSEGEKVFKPIIKDYSSSTEMFTDFLSQAKKQKVPIDKTSEVYQEALKNVDDVKIFYGQQDFEKSLKNLLSKNQLKEKYQKSEAFQEYNKYDNLAKDFVKQHGEQGTNFYYAAERDKYSFDKYLEDLQEHPDKLLKLYEPNKNNKLNLSNPVQRLIARKEENLVRNLLDKNRLNVTLTNKAKQIDEDLSDYEVNKVLDPTASDRQEKLAKLMVTDVLPNQIKNKNKSLTELDYKKQLANINKDLESLMSVNPVEHKDEIRALQKAKGDLNEQFLLKTGVAFQPKTPSLFTLFSKPKKQLSDEDYASGLYLSNLLAKPPTNKRVKFLGENTDPVDSTPYDWMGDGKEYEQFNSRFNVIRNDGVTPGYYTTPKIEAIDSGAKEKAQGWSSHQSRAAPNLVKSLYREHLGKWDWSNPNIHKAIGAGILLGAGSTQLKQGGRLKLKFKKK